MIRRTITAIKNYFTDTPQEEEWVFIPPAKMPVEKLEVMTPKEEITALTEHESVKNYFKTPKVEARSSFMNDFVFHVMLEMCAWVEKELNIHPIITETVTTLEEDKALKRVSSTHREGRAFDMRTLRWKPNEIEKFQKHFNEKYLHLGAITTSGKPIFILHHDSGHGDHFHVQFNKSFSNVNNIQGKLG